MESDGEIQKVIKQYRRDLLAKERSAASELVRVYGEAWKRIKAELERLHTEYEAAKAHGEKVDASWIYQYNRARAFRDQIERELLTFAQYADGKIREQQFEAIEAAESHAEKLTRLALGKPPAGLAVGWNRIDRASVETLLGMTQAESPLHQLLLSIAAAGAKEAENVLVQGMLLGRNPREVAVDLRKALGVTLSRALTIARTETLRAHREATRASYQANSDIVKGWIWHSALDTRTCAMCWAMHGTEHSIDEVLDDHPNGRCLTPGTVVSGPIATAFVSRYYEGNIVTIRTASGKFLSVTPNHPVLTSRGWIAANLIEEGDDVVSYSGNEWRPSGVSPDDYQVPTVVENIPDSLNLARLITMPTSPEDFHGDGVGSNIHVIYTNRFLGNRSNTSVVKPFFKKYFCRGLPNRSFLSSYCPSEFFFKWNNSTSYSVLGNFDPFTVLFNRNTLRKQFIRLGLVSEADIISNQSSSDCASRYTKGFSEEILRFSRQISLDKFRFWNIEFRPPGFTGRFPDEMIASNFVPKQVMSLEVISQALFRSVEHGSSILRTITRNVSLDRVLEISITRFSGHVYNLQTSVEWYIANGIITHNCAMIPKTVTWEEIGAKYGIDLSGIPDTNPVIESGISQFEKLPAEQQIAILGQAKYKAWKDGQFTLSDLVGRRYSKAWGSMRYEKSLAELLKESQKEKGLNTILKQLEEEIVNQRFETSIVLDENGNIVLRKDGNEKSVKFTDAEMALMKGKILTHNHPAGWNYPEDDPHHNGNSLSVADLLLAIDGGLKEVRAISPGYIHSLKPGDKGWIPSNFAFKAYNTICKQVSKEFETLVLSGKMKLSMAEAEYYHEVMTRFAKEYGFVYNRIRR